MTYSKVRDLSSAGRSLHSPQVAAGQRIRFVRLEVSSLWLQALVCLTQYI